MVIFLTGASGFVGGAIGQTLVKQHRVLAMVRSAEATEKVTRLGMQAVRCDLDTVTAEHMAGAEAVVHAAAKVEAWGDPKDFWRVNVRGTERLLHSSQEAGVKRFVFISSEQAVFAGRPIREGNESLPYPRDQKALPYASTKSIAEQKVLGADRSDFTTLALRPPIIWGPGDRVVLPNLIRFVRSGRFRWINHGTALISTAYIDNVVHAAVLALSAGSGGRAYFITDGEVCLLKDFITRLLETQGVSPPNQSMPAWFASALAAASEALWLALRFQGEPPLTRTATAMMAHDRTYSIALAQRELGYHPIASVAAGLQQMVELETRRSL